MTEVHAVLTGPIKGTVTLSDGTEVEVGPAQIFAESLEQAQEIAHAIGERHAAEGHPDHDRKDPFEHDEKLSKKNFAAAKKDGK